MANHKSGAERYNDRMNKIVEKAKKSFDTPRYRAAAYDLIMASRDALTALQKLPDAEGAYRVTCIQQLKSALRKAGAISEQDDRVTR